MKITIHLVFSVLLLTFFLFGCCNLTPNSVPLNISSPELPPSLPSDLSIPSLHQNPQPNSICVSPSKEFSYQIPNQQIGNRPLLVLISDLNSQTDPAPNIEEVDRAYFGASPSVSDYLFNISNGKLVVQKVGIYKYLLDPPYETYFQDDPNDLDGDGWVDGKKLWTTLLLKSDSDIDYSSFDKNHDGYVYPDELGIHIIVPHNVPYPGGAMRYLESRQNPYSPLVLDGVTLVAASSSGSGNPVSVGTPSHELLHLFAGAPDLYFSYFFPYASGGYSIMDQFWWIPHLDPYDKLRSGWLNSIQIDRSGCYYLDRIDNSATIHIIEKRNSNPREFYILENRQRGTYDSQLFDTGIGIWRVIEPPGNYVYIQKPSQVLDSDWATIAKTDWGRLGLWMFRPSYYPFNDSSALWSNEDLVSPMSFNWSDGSSAFTLVNISSSYDQMSYRVVIPNR